ncbi:MAG: hypothetical protein IJV07_03885 [Alphaproteobacteria bacterium]|nr:hypothetical protein [Alphaproteobacteria bacterium]
MRNDSGRSMVEMLGVLAIVGLLSLGGVLGYRYALDKHRANELLHSVHMMVTTAHVQIGSGRQLDLTEFRTHNLMDYPFLAVQNNDRTFSLTVFDVPKGVCEKVMSASWSLPKKITVNGVVNGRCDSDENNILFRFYDMLYVSAFSGGSTGGAEAGEKHGSDSGTKEPSCRSEVIPIHNCNGTVTECCPDNGNECAEPTNCCLSDSQCSDGYVCVGNTCNCPSKYFLNAAGQCVSCSDIYRYTASAEECQKCDSTGNPRKMNGAYCDLICPDGWFQNANGNCTICSNTAAKETSAEECAKCDSTPYHRYMDGNYCTLGGCHGGWFQDSKGLCRECSAQDSYRASADECAKCADTGSSRKVFGQFCKPASCPSGQFYDADGNCRSCSDMTGYQTTAEECAKCSDPSRKMEGNSCVLDTCSSGSFRGKNGTCISCSQIGRYEPYDETECAKCDQTNTPRILGSDKGTLYCGLCANGQFFQTDYMVCRSCSDKDGYVSTAAACSACDDTDNSRKIFGDKCFPSACPTGYFQDTSGECRTCSDANKRTPVTEAECAKCDSTDYPRGMNGKYCVLKICPTGYFQDTSGECHACSDRMRYAATAEQCNKCALTDNPRKVSGNYCNPICSEGWFQNANGNCTICSNTAAKETSAEECAKCDSTPYKRTMVGNKCSLSGGCPNGYFKGKDDYGDWVCLPCSDAMAYEASTTDCAKCDSTNTPRQITGGKCVLK